MTSHGSTLQATPGTERPGETDGERPVARDAIDRLIAQLRGQDGGPGHRGVGSTRRPGRDRRYRMVIDGPFVETKEFGMSAVAPDREV
jgi:hypothetical protein